MTLHPLCYAFHAKGYDGDEYASRNGSYCNLQLLCGACNSDKGAKTREKNSAT